MGIEDNNDFNDAELSNKIVFLLSLLTECEKKKDKVLVLSYSSFSLDIIEHFLKTTAGFEWKLDEDYFVLKGNIPESKRTADIAKFNDDTNERAK